MIIAKGIRKKYGNKSALNGVSLKAEKGKITAILGPNGAGKTTLIRIILGLIFPDDGEVRILDKDPFKDKSIFKKIGYIQELPNLPPFLTGREVLEFSAKIKGVDKSEIPKLLEMVGMTENADKKIAKYSKGMIQRIAIAEAMLGNPEVLIMDEPNMGTDPVLITNFRSMVKNIAKDGRKVLMTSHEMEDVKKIADKVYFIFKGSVYFEGTVEDLIKRFLGIRVIVETEDIENLKAEANKINFIKGVEEEGKNKVILTLTEDKREELIKRLVLAGVRIRSFYLDNELEEAYLNIVKEAMSND
ncbi:ABC transporter ATP-binding protein [Acidianus ambivalens]|uniref:ATP-binding cassette domain-containing protein n=1 Tax=Acidianus ambivalens TaxID=2283 RepID=A0A650CVH7_ACIAM|nr:ABC transporter ATP-binding protein [Acidianus ambivalens]MQL55567.1 ATP-binding cassette domain-containing protein [Acidianus ambivalens]QGR21846.1 ATP-binding cassette domain-containing protein [Acidianus ambivalens]